jgi:hypothetical protein
VSRPLMILRKIAKIYGGTIKLTNFVDGGASLGEANWESHKIYIARKYRSVTTGRVVKLTIADQLFTAAHEIAHLIQFSSSTLREDLHIETAQERLFGKEFLGASKYTKRTLMKHMCNLMQFELDADVRAKHLLIALNLWMPEEMTEQLYLSHTYYYRLATGILTGLIPKAIVNEPNQRRYIDLNRPKLNRKLLNMYIKFTTTNPEMCEKAVRVTDQATE